MGTTCQHQDYHCVEHGAYTLQQFAEIILTEGSLALFQTLIVHHKTLADVLIERAVAHWRNRAALREFTRYPTEMMASKL